MTAHKRGTDTKANPILLKLFYLCKLPKSLTCSDMCIKDNGVNIVINLLNKHDLHRYESPTIILFNQMARYCHIYIYT